MALEYQTWLTDPSTEMEEEEEKEDRWGELPWDLLLAIEKRLVLCSDKAILSSICKNWHIALHGTLPNLKSGLPYLLLPSKNDDSSIQACFGLYDPQLRKIYHLDLPQLRGKLFRGSSHGWLFTVENSPTILMINLFTRVQIQLPPRSKFPDIKKYSPRKIGQEYQVWNPARRVLHRPCPTMVQRNWIHKIVLSSSSIEDTVVVAIYGEFRRLAYCKKGDTRWFHGYGGTFMDVIFHDGKFYALACDGELFACDFSSQPRMTQMVPPPSRRLLRTSALYLVRTAGAFLMVERYTPGYDDNRVPSYETLDFRVWLLKVEPSGASWRRLKTIGGAALFLGYNHSFAIPSCHLGLENDSIYFTDDVKIFHEEGVEGGSDIGVFNLVTAKVQRLPGFECDSVIVWPPPIWIVFNSHIDI